ncbi:unnamed protein product [Aphanomyces euteiches]|uniref:MYND-type domain-containing protein n=1 Tax=Aphanomyces euteiches TaxID=100861 RepID=A0A6G0WGH3_9STRA|nr:hypothetical protein Ae201684_015453 [Aphanomyces euteiches]KAH9097547.1 hypothetical protein Ae201684P_001025 [Aphanomyces euteiches]KAH9143475.1 hypothetical protein AeRB84_012516 [Aphanomyces euteiches]
MSKRAGVDANDYSRFNNIVDSDEEDNSAKENVKPQAKAAPCRNCSKDGAKLKCSICKKAAYCNRQCQTSDWTFHRRTCKKPEDDKDKDVPAVKKPTTSDKPKAPRTEIVREDEEEDLEDARGYKNGLPYFHREQSQVEKELIGNIAPQKIQDTTAPAAITAPPKHDGSAWNHAGTFEERDTTTWCKDRLGELLRNLQVKSNGFTIKGGEIKDVRGESSICVVRGKKRFLFDFDFTIEWEVIGKSFKGKLVFKDIDNEGDNEITCRYDKSPSDATEAQQLSDAIKSGFQKEALARIGQFITEYNAL